MGQSGPMTEPPYSPCSRCCHISGSTLSLDAGGEDQGCICRPNLVVVAAWLAWSLEAEFVPKLPYLFPSVNAGPSSCVRSLVRQDRKCTCGIMFFFLDLVVCRI